MHGYVSRNIEHQIKADLKQFPAVALIGPRQCGKSTTAQVIGEQYTNFIYLDLERPSDQRKLRDPELFFRSNDKALVCLDEVQLAPHIFPVLRSLIDERIQRASQFLILGSASRDLLQQSSETLAGRIAYNELTPFTYNEILKPVTRSLQQYWVRGGFPNSVLVDTDTASARWRENFVRTYLERDIPQIGFRVPAERIGRLWRMCAHYHGQLLNASGLGNALGVTSTTIRHHLEILEQTFMIRLLQPRLSNAKKRLVKSPKLYIRDSGILHTLLEIADMNSILAHPQVGASWEGLGIENVITALPGWTPSFYRTSNGAELDLIMEYGQTRLGFEFKAASNPVLSKGFYAALHDIKPNHTWVVIPEGTPSPLQKNVTVCSLTDCIAQIQEHTF